MALNAPYTPNTVIQSTQVSNDLVGLANGSNDTTTNSLSTFRTEDFFDHVISGIVWSGDSYAVNRNASMTAGVVSIGGTRFAISAVTARTFTASTDTYIDISTAGAVTYSEVANNAASASLTSGYLRIGIIVTGATTIAAAGSVNQGQETKVLPIASSIPYQVTDSSGNLICPRDPNRSILGYRQISADFTTASTVQTQVTGVSMPIIIPTNRKILLIGYAPIAGGSVAGSQVGLGIWDGVVNVGTRLNIQLDDVVTGDNTRGTNATVQAPTTPSSTSKTYNLGFNVNGGTGRLTAVATAPVWLMALLK